MVVLVPVFAFILNKRIIHIVKTPHKPKKKEVRKKPKLYVLMQQCILCNYIYVNV